MDAVSRTPVPVNEPVRQYQPGSHERAALERGGARTAHEREIDPRRSWTPP